MKRTGKNEGERTDEKTAGGAQGELEATNPEGADGERDARRKKKAGENGGVFAVEPESPSKKYKYVIQNARARAAVRNRRNFIVFCIILLAFILLAALAYCVVSAIRINDFTVFVDPSGTKMLSLSHDEAFTNATEVLEIKGPTKITNTTLAKGKNRVVNEDGEVAKAIEEKLLRIVRGEGKDSEAEKGDHFISSSFYIKNISDEPQTYSEKLWIEQVTKNLQDCIRVMLVRGYDETKEDFGDCEITVYAKRKKNGEPEEVVKLKNESYGPIVITKDKDGRPAITHKEIPNSGNWMTEPFKSDTVVFCNDNLPLAPNQTVKYSVVFWIEGWDPECTNDKIGGTIQMKFGFEHGSDVDSPTGDKRFGTGGLDSDSQAEPSGTGGLDSDSHAEPGGTGDAAPEPGGAPAVAE